MMRILSLGECAVTVEFASDFDQSARDAVVALDQAIADARASGELAGVLDAAPTFRSLTIHYDPLRLSRATLEPQLRALASKPQTKTSQARKHWRIPVCYGGVHGPDLPELADAAGLSEHAVIDLHATTEVTVHMLGFLPGFAFMGDIAPPLRLPRRKEPRLRVPPGSVAVADRLTGIYPLESPGGWHLIGFSPLPLFDTQSNPPSLFAPADLVQFAPVSPARLKEIETALAAGEVSAHDFCEEP